MNNILNNNNKELFISLLKPYKNIKKIISFEDVLLHDSFYFNLSKYFRFSFNNINYSNWVDLTNFNLQNINIQFSEDFWIEYKYILNEIDNNEQIEFKSISLEVINKDAKIEKVLCNNFNCCNNVILQNCSSQNLFNPYNLGNAPNIYNQLAVAVSNMFGFEVEYYKTNPNLNSKDILLNEYSIYNVEKKCIIKVIIPDNTLPTKEIQFNSQQGLMSDLFEIHIVKSIFEDAFGLKEIPRTKDYLYFPYLKKVYKINSVMLADENNFNTQTYFKVNLSEYTNSSNMIDEENINTDLNDLIKNNSYENVMGEELNDEMIKVTKPQQYNDMNTNRDGSDLIRNTLDKRIVITKNNIINKKTYQLISDNYYDFTKIEEKTDVIEYKYSEGLKNKFAMTFFLNLKTKLKVENLNIQIKNVLNASDTFLNSNFEGIIIETLTPHNFIQGDIINIKNGNVSYNGINYITTIIDDYKFVINKSFVEFSGGIINKKYEKLNIINNENEFNIFIINDSIIVLIKDKCFNFDYVLNINYWNYFILNYSIDFNQLSLFIYNSEFSCLYKKLYTINDIEFSKKPLKIISGKYWFTNFRLFRECIEEEQHESILSQLVVHDSHLALITDNATPRLRLKKYSNNR